MVGFTLGMYRRILASCLAVRGTRKALWVWLSLVPVYACFTRLTLWLDRIVFPAYRRVEVTAPIFILGHPRSGTTLLQRLLTQTRAFAAFEAWEMAFPALSVRGVIRPLIRRLARRGGAVVGPEIGHQLRLTEIDEDEALFLHVLDTEMITTISPIGFVDQELDRLFFHDRQPHAQRSVQFFKDIWRRQLFRTGRSRILSKLSPSALRTKTLLGEFPDARIIYLVRSPLEVIPSFLSLHRNGMERLWSLPRLAEAQKRFFFERKYRVSVRWYLYMQDLIERGEIPRGQLLEITYNEQIKDLRNTMAKIAEFTGVEISEELQATIDAASASPPSYRRQHTNFALEEFGLTEERIRTDLKRVFDRYGF